MSSPVSNHQQYIDAVFQAQNKALSADENNWFKDYVNQPNEHTLKERAETIIGNWKLSIKSPDPQSLLLRYVFSEKFSANKQAITKAARQVPDSSASLYPLWKDRVLSKIDTLQSYFQNPYIHNVVSLIVSQMIYKMCYSPLFDHLKRRVTASALFHFLPPLINHTPIAVIRFGNRVFNAMDYATSHKIALLCGLAVLQYSRAFPTGVKNFSRRISLLGTGRLLWNLSGNPFNIVKATSYASLTSLFSRAIKHLINQEQEKKSYMSCQLFIHCVDLTKGKAET